MSRYFLFFLYDSSVVETGLAPPACVADSNYVLKTYLLFSLHVSLQVFPISVLEHDTTFLSIFIFGKLIFAQ